MAENIWLYGEYDLDKDTLFAYLQSNLDSYLNHYDYNDDERQLFGDTLSSIKQTIIDDTLSNKDGFGSFVDNSGTLEDTELTRNALHYLHKVASGYGTKIGARKKNNSKEKEVQPELYNSSKHGLNRHIIQQINPGLLQMQLSEEDAYKAIQDNLTFWRNSYDSDEDAIKGYSDMLDSYIQREDLKGLNYSNYGGSYDTHILDVTRLKNALADGVINKEDLRLFNKLGLSGHISLFNLNPVSEPENKGAFSHIKWDNDNTKKLPEDAPEPQEGFEAVLLADGSYEWVPKDETEVNNFNIEDFWSSLDTNDKVRLGLILPELGSAISALVPGWGTAVSAATGFGTTIANLVNDLTDDDLSIWDAFKGAAFSGTMDVVGLLPGAGVAGKASKLSKILKPVAYIISSAMGVYGLNEAKESFDKIISDPESVDAQDIQNLAAGMLALAGFSSTIGTKRAVNRHTTSQKMASVKTKSGKNADITEELLELLKKTKGYEEQNKKFKEWTGEELPSEFKPRNITYKYKEALLIASGPKTSKYTKKTIIESSDRDAKLLQTMNGKKSTKDSAEPKVEEPKVEKAEVKNTEEPKVEVKPEENPKTEEPKTDSSNKEAKTEAPKVEETSKKQVLDDTKATDIKPNIESKAGELANVNSKVAKPTISGIKKRLKSYYRGKWEELDEINDAIAKAEYRRTEAGSQGSIKADLVAKKGGGSREYEVLLRRLILSGESEAVAKETLRKAGVYKEGGIIKADEGLKFPEWFNYKQQFLTGWDRDLRKDKWTTQGVGFHTDADSLQSVYDANANYISDTNAIGSDIQNYYDNGKYGTISDLVKAYNNDATSINNFWKIDHKYGENTGNHAPTFKKLFASRSADGKIGKLDYNLGYLENLENIMGSTMWHRRMDWYEKPFELLDDISKLNRIHPVKLVDGKYGYVYKKHDGTLGELDNQEAERLLNLEDPDQNIAMTGTIPEVTITANKLNPKGTEIPYEERKQTVPELVTPEKPKDSFYTPDKALAFFNYLRARGHNNLALKDALRLMPLLYDPNEHHRNVYGDLLAKTLGENLAADIRYLTRNMLTADIDKWMTHRLEGEKLALQYIQQGWQADNETMRRMSELSWLQEKENKESRYNIAMKNRENMHQVATEKILAEINKNRADYESGTNFINELRTWLVADKKAKDEKANLLFSRQLLSYINNNPDKYIPGWGPYLQNIWDKSTTGATLDLGEQRVLAQIRSNLADAYYNEMYGMGDYYGFGIKKPEWKGSFAKGGKITNDMAKAVIAYLKESNKNYNKDIDRSIRGLYNHIKLLRKK